jgi:hypothetical protein
MAMSETAGQDRPLAKSARWSWLWAAGMLLVFVGERMIGAGKSRGVATSLGLVAVLAAMAVRFVRARAAAPDRRKVEETLLGLYALGLLAVVLYMVQSDLWTSLFGKPLEKHWPKLATALGALWPAIWVVAAWPILLVEMAYAQIARAPRLELGRIRDAMLSGFGIAFALVFAFAIAYVSSERDKKVDLAYFRTTRPGEVTRRIVRNLDQPIEVALFFPSGNEVREEVDNYLSDLAKESGQLKVTHYDFDIDPLKAKEYGVSTNGVLVFVRGKRHEQLGLPKEIEAARSPLRQLDKEVQQRLMMVVKPPRTFAFTLGHGERSWERPESDTDKRPGIKTLRDVLVDQTYDVRTLSAAEGLGQEVPKDISVVAVIGPQKPFLPEESAALSRFIDRGGRVLIALDPENKVDMHEVLEPLQLTYMPEMLANDQVFARRTHQDSDRANLVTATFTSHPSVTTLQRLANRAFLIFPGAGWINTKRDRSTAVPVDAPIKAHYATFVDKNGNFQPDPGEDRRAWELAATAVKKDARVFLLADSDCLDDEAIRAGANELLALDVAHWLVGDEAYAGVASTEADVPITHTRKQDVVWFYGTIFLAPALVLGAGVFVTRRRRRRPPTGGGVTAGGGGVAAGGSASTGGAAPAQGGVS